MDEEKDLYEILHCHQDNLHFIDYEIAKLEYEREKVLEEISKAITALQERHNT